MPEASFAYTKGKPKQFRRSDLANPVTREFCARLRHAHPGSLARSARAPCCSRSARFDDPSVFGGPQMVIFTIDKQSFHHVPEGVPTFERAPDSRRCE